MAIITTIINNKGGVGKTSSCTAMGSILGALGYRCLMIDNDFQGNTTATFIPENQEIKKSIVDIFHMTDFTKENVQECILHTQYAGIDIIPALPEHRDTDVYLYSQVGKRIVQKVLNKALRQIKDEYDFILIDTHPDANMVAQNALCASDYVLTPVRPDGYSYQGITPTTNEILKIAQDEDMNPNLNFLGVFITASNTKTGIYKTLRNFYQTEFGDDFIPVTIRQDSAVDAVTTYLSPLPYLLGGQDYRSNAKWKGIYDYLELMKYIEMIEYPDYVVARTAIEILDMNVIVSIDKTDKSNPKICGLEYTAEEPVLTEYDNHPCVTGSKLIEDALANDTLEHIKQFIITIANIERMIKVGKKKYAKVKELVGDQKEI